MLSMSILNVEEIKKIADLARMAISDDEAQSSARKLSGILEYFEAIRVIDTTDTLPADDVTGLPAGRQGLKNVMREDTAHDAMLADPKDLLAHTITRNGYVVVPGVFADNGVS